MLPYARACVQSPVHSAQSQSTAVDHVVAAVVAQVAGSNRYGRCIFDCKEL